jgi:hypothetical protein
VFWNPHLFGFVRDISTASPISSLLRDQRITAALQFLKTTLRYHSTRLLKSFNVITVRFQKGRAGKSEHPSRRIERAQHVTVAEDATLAKWALQWALPLTKKSVITQSCTPSQD